MCAEREFDGFEAFGRHFFAGVQQLLPVQVPDLGLHDYVLAGDMDTGTTIKFMLKLHRRFKELVRQHFAAQCPLMLHAYSLHVKWLNSGFLFDCRT